METKNNKTVNEMLDELDKKREGRISFAERFRRRDLNENQDDEDLKDTRTNQTKKERGC